MCCVYRDRIERKPQQWNMMVPRRRQKQCFPLEEEAVYEGSRSTDQTTAHYGTRRPEYVIFSKCCPLNIWSRLAKPILSCPDYSAHLPPIAGVRPNIDSPRLRLESLPAEMLEMLLARPELDKADVVAVGIASDMLRPHVLAHIHRDVIRTAGAWAGCEIACTGTHVAQLPDSFIKDNLARDSVKMEPGYRTALYRPRFVGRSINWVATESYETAEDAEEMWETAISDHANPTSSPPERMQLKSLCDAVSSTCARMWKSHTETKWRLRNLTTHQYIRCLSLVSPVSGSRGIIDHDDAPDLSVDDVLMMHIACTYEPGYREYSQQEIYNGAWAGHCFDIVSLEGGGGDVISAQDGWTDATDDVVEKANKLKRDLRDLRKEGAHQCKSMRRKSNEREATTTRDEEIKSDDPDFF